MINVEKNVMPSTGIELTMLLLLCLPNRERIPLAAHTIRLSPTEPVSVSTPFGDIKIPDPEK